MVQEELGSNVPMKITYVPIEKLRNAPLPLREMDEDVVEGITGSIKTKGLLEPLRVNRKGGTYVIINGQHRKEALVRAGIKKVPCMVNHVDDLEALELMITESTHRNAFVHPWNLGMAFHLLLMKRYDGVVNRLAEAIHKPNQYIRDRIDVYLKLEPSIKGKIGKTVTVEQAVVLSKKYSHKEQLEMVKTFETPTEFKHYYHPPVNTCVCPNCEAPHKPLKVKLPA